MRQYLKKYQVAGKTFEELMMEGLRPQTAVQDNTYVTNPRIEEARRDEREGMTPAKKTQAAAAKKKRIAEEKRQELVNAAANQGTISADTQSDFDKNIQRAYYIASNPMSALGHYAKYGYVPQGNLGNYGQRFDQSPMEMIVNGVNPFSWANAGYRFTNGLLNSESYDGLNASLDLIESMPMLGMMKSALPAAQNAIQNTYRLLPEGTFKNYSKLSNADKSYRVAGMDAYDDFLENHIVRSVTPPPKPGMSFEERVMSQRTTGFPSFQKGYADLNYLPESGKGVVFETSLPTYKRGQINPVTGTPIKGRHYAHRVIDPNTGHTMTSIPAEDIRAFGVEPHWLKGYPLLTDGKTLTSTSQLSEGITPVGISGFRNFRGIDIPIEDFKLGFPYVDSEGKTIPVKDLQDFLSRDKAISNLSWSQMTGTPIDETASSGFQNSRGIDIPIKDFRLGFPYRGHRGIDIPLQDLQSFLSRDEAISNAEWERMVRNNTKKNGGEMIKRADGSYSPRGFWDNIRDNVGSGKKATKEMLAMEEKLNSKADGGIHIDPSKKGTFKAQATRMNMGVQEAASHILANKEDYSPEMVKKAVFAHNFANQYGGLVDEELIGYEMGGGVEALEKFFGGGLNFKDNPELSYGKLDNYYKAGDKVDYKIEKNLLQNLEPTKFNTTAAGLSGLAAPNSFAQYLPNQGLGSKLKGWMGLLGAAGSLGLAGSKLANLGNNTKVESNLYNDTTKESGATKDILQARLNASGDKSTTPKFSMTNFASQINDMEKEKMKNFQNTPENNSENYKQFMPQLNFKPEADESQKQTNNGEFPQDLLRKQTPNILSPDFNGSIETTPSTLQYNQFIPQAAFDSRYPDKIMPVQSFSQPIPAGVGPQRNQSILSTDYDGSSFENSGQETYNRNTYPNPSYTPAMLQNIIDNIQTKKDGGLTKFFPGGPFPGNPFAGNPLQATFNAQGIGTSGMGNTITGGNYMDFNGVSPEQVRETAPIAIPQNNQTNQTITPTTYNTTYMDPVGMRAANNFLTGLGMFNQSPIGERQNILNEQRNFRDSGNTDSMAPVNNPQNPFGVFTPNAGPGINNNLVSRPAVQDFGTKGNFAKCGGQKMYREGGSYMLTKDQILNILANGGEIEFM